MMKNCCSAFRLKTDFANSIFICPKAGLRLAVVGPVHAGGGVDHVNDPPCRRVNSKKTRLQPAAASAPRSSAASRVLRPAVRCRRQPGRRDRSGPWRSATRSATCSSGTEPPRADAPPSVTTADRSLDSAERCDRCLAFPGHLGPCGLLQDEEKSRARSSMRGQTRLGNRFPPSRLRNPLVASAPWHRWQASPPPGSSRDECRPTP